MRTGSNSSRSDRPNLFYPVWVYPNGKLHSIGDLISITDDKVKQAINDDELTHIFDTDGFCM